MSFVNILKNVFVMVLVSIRTRTKCCILEMFQRGVGVQNVFVVSKRETRSESTYSKGLKCAFPLPLDVAILLLVW